MNYFQTRFHFNENASGTGGAAPSPAPAPAAPSSAPAPAPASPTPTPTPTPGAGAQPSSDPWAGLDGEFDQDLDTIVIADGVTGTDPGAQPAPTPPEPAVAPVPPAATPVPGTPPEPVAAPAPVAPVPTSASSRALLDTTVDGFRANKDELAKWAGENLFKLSPQDAEALVTNAEEALPRLAGRVYAELMLSTGNLIKNIVPNLISESIESSHSAKTKSQEAVGEFYKTHADLNEKDHGAAVSRWAKSYRQANPAATRAEAIAFVGRAVRIEAGLPMPGPAPAPAARVAPFAPARPGGRQPQVPGEHDPYSGLGEDFDQG